MATFGVISHFTRTYICPLSVHIIHVSLRSDRSIKKGCAITFPHALCVAPSIFRASSFGRDRENRQIGYPRDRIILWMSAGYAFIECR